MERDELEVFAGGASSDIADAQSGAVGASDDDECESSRGGIAWAEPGDVADLAAPARGRRRRRIDHRFRDFETMLSYYDVVIGGIGGENLEKSVLVLQPGGLDIGIA